MEYEPGAQVAIKKADITGTIVKRRLPGEDIYLVHIEAEDRYYRAENLELIPERRTTFPLARDSKEWNEELIHLATLIVGQNRDVADLAEQLEIRESIERLGIIVPIQS